MRQSTKRLSKAQQEFMIRLDEGTGAHPPKTAGRESGTLRSAWMRTAKSIARLGRIYISRDNRTGIVTASECMPDDPYYSEERGF